MRFYDVEAEEEEPVLAGDEEEEVSEEGSDVDKTLGGFIVGDDSQDSSAEEADGGESTMPPRAAVLFNEESQEETTENEADDAAAEAGSLDDNDSQDNDDDDEDDGQGCGGPSTFLKSRNAGLVREVVVAGRTVPLPSHTSPVSLILQDGLSGDLEVEPYEIWRHARARPFESPVFTGPSDKWPKDWFDTLEICKDSRGSYCVRSTKRVVAEQQEIRFPSGKTIVVPAKRVIVEHSFIPYDEKIWRDPANYIPASSAADAVNVSDSSVDDEIDFSAAVSAAQITKNGFERKRPVAPQGGLSEEEIDPLDPVGRILSSDTEDEQRPQPNKVEKVISEIKVPKKSSVHKTKRSRSSKPALPPAAPDVEVVSVSDDDSFGSAKADIACSESTELPEQRKSKKRSTASSGVIKETLATPKAVVSTKTHDLVTSKQKEKRKARLELIRLKKDLEEEDPDALNSGLWTLMERKSKRQRRMAEHRRKANSKLMQRVRQAGYTYCIDN